MRAIDIDTLEEIQAHLSAVINKSVNNLSKHKKNVYISAPHNTNVDKVILNTIKELQKKIKSPLYTIYYPMDSLIDDSVAKVNKNLSMLHNCDIFVALISNINTATANEIGLATALGKRILLVGYDTDDFIYGPNEFLKYAKADRITIDKFAKFLQGSLGSRDFVEK